MTRIQQDGKVYEPTGEYRTPKRGEPFVGFDGLSSCVAVIIAKRDFDDVRSCYRAILREVTEPSPDAGVEGSASLTSSPAASHDTGGGSPIWYDKIRHQLGWAEWSELLPHRKENLAHLHEAWLECHDMQLVKATEWAAENDRLKSELAQLRAEREAVFRLGPHPIEQVRKMPLDDFVRTRFVQVWEFNEKCDEVSRLRDVIAKFEAAVKGLRTRGYLPRLNVPRKDWRARMESNAEFCAEVAEKVMGWKYAGICRRGPVYDACLLVRGHAVNQIEVGVDFRPDIDANDDYLVLEHVRTTWDYNLGERADGSHGKDIIGFSEALRHVSVDVDRHKMSDGRTLPSSDFTWTSLIQYVPGDYSRAALQALKEQSNDT